jgi:hypothetical protein
MTLKFQNKSIYPWVILSIISVMNGSLEELFGSVMDIKLIKQRFFNSICPKLSFELFGWLDSTSVYLRVSGLN